MLNQKETYGFVIWVLTLLFFVVYFIWAFVPDERLQAMGILYYPSKHWAMTFPGFIMLTTISLILFA